MTFTQEASRNMPMTIPSHLPTPQFQSSNRKTSDHQSPLTTDGPSQDTTPTPHFKIQQSIRKSKETSNQREKEQSNNSPTRRTSMRGGRLVGFFSKRHANQDDEIKESDGSSQSQSHSSFQSVEIDEIEEEKENKDKAHLSYNNAPLEQQDKIKSLHTIKQFVDDTIDQEDILVSEVVKDEEIIDFPSNEKDQVIKMPYNGSLLQHYKEQNDKSDKVDLRNVMNNTNQVTNKQDKETTLSKIPSEIKNLSQYLLKHESSKFSQVVDQYIKYNEEQKDPLTYQYQNYLQIKANSQLNDQSGPENTDLGVNRLTTMFSVNALTTENNQDLDQTLMNQILSDKPQDPMGSSQSLNTEDQQRKKREEEFEQMKNLMRINDEDLEREIQLEQKEEEDVQDEDQFESHFCNIFNMILSFLFLIMVMTECDFSSQQKIGTIMLNLFDATAYDKDGTTRQSIDSGDQIYDYMRDLLIPMIFDEPTKITASNPYITDVKYLRSLVNETTHYLNNFNYFVGLRVTYKRKKLILNEDANSYTVLPYIMQERFTVDSGDSYEDYQEPIKVENSSKIYYHKTDSGNLQVGGYTEIILGNTTLSEALKRLEDMNNAGWFEDDSMLYFAVEIMTYNINYQHAGFFIFQHSRDITGILNTEPGRFYTMYPTLYDDLQNAKVILRIIVFTAYTLCLSVNFIRFVWIITHHIKIFATSKSWSLQWYYYLDVLIYFFSSYSLYFWFQNLATRGQFKLPLQSESDFEYWNENQYYIRSFLQVSPIAVMFLCVKNVQILSTYFPAFGVLFQTIKKSRHNALSYFIMSIILSFGFIVAGTIMFGNWVETYNSIGNSAMSLFFIMMTQSQTEYSSLEESNAIGAPLYFYPASVIFQFILINMFLTLIFSVYNDIRERKQLESEAIAKILVKEYTWNLKLWTNFLFCRVDRRSKEEFFLEDEEDEVKREQLRQQVVELQNQQKLAMTDLRTTFLYNKVQLFGRKQMKTKEIHEDDILQNKKKILRKKKIDIINRILKFKTVDSSDLDDLKQCFIYFTYIIIFVTVILLQMNIVTIREATKPMRVFMEGGKFEHDIDTQRRFLHLISKDELNFNQTSELHRILDAADSEYGADNENVYGAYEMKSSLYDIYSSQDIESWLLLKFYKYLYYNARESGQFLSQNYFFGPVRMRMTVRLLKFHPNENHLINSTIKFVRNSNSYSADSPIDQTNEVTSSFIGNSSHKVYNYTKPGNIRSYAQQGGFVFYFSNDTKQALALLRQVYQDKLIEETLSTLVMEIATYNPNYKMVICTQVFFEYSNSGFIIPRASSKAIRKTIYHNSLDYFRGFLECVFVIYIAYQNYYQIAMYLRIFKNVYLEDLYIIPTKDENGQDYKPTRFDKYCQHIGLPYQKHKDHHIFFFLILNLYYIILWIFRVCINVIKAFISYINQGVFHIISFVSIVMSNYLIVIWVKLVVLLYIGLRDDGSVREDYTKFLDPFEYRTANHIDILSYVVYLMENYMIVAALNALMNFFRIFQFFQFSIKLSVFTEILKDSKNDILYFLAMFIIILLGYSVMASAYYGENLKEYSDLLQTFIELFQMMVTFFEYESFAKYSSLTPLFFISFMIFFTMFLMSMLVAIILAHYDEYEEQQVLIKKSMSGEDSNFFKLIFILMRKTIAPDSYAFSQNKVKRFFYRVLMKIENYLGQQKVEEDLYKEEIQNLKHQLTNKYKLPKYNVQRDVHYYLKPYLKKHQVITQENYTKFIKENLETENGGDLQFNIGVLETQNVEQQQEQPKSWQDYLLEKNPDAKAFQELKIGVIGDINNENNTDSLTQSTRWLSALEDELYTISNYNILYTELLHHEDQYINQDLVKFYNVQEFTPFQASFLAAVTEQDQITIWKEANVSQKLQIWEILDFNKMIEDQNKIQSDDTLENFFDFVNKTSNNKTTKQKPIITFKRVNRSPEYKCLDYSRASDFQKNLWKNHTTHKEKFQLWFQHFNSYHRVKLWTKLQFSEDYALSICNSQSLYRQDLVIFITEKLDDIRQEYLEYLMKKYEKLLIKKMKVINVKSEVRVYRKVLDAIRQVEETLINITSRKIRLQEILKIVPQKIKDKYITPDFYLQIWSMIQEREYDEILPLTGTSIIDTLRKIRSGVKHDDNDNNKPKKKDKQSQLSVIDKFDLEEQKDLKPKYHLNLKDIHNTPTIFSPAPEKSTNLMTTLGINVDRILRSQLNLKPVSDPASVLDSRRESQQVHLKERMSTAEPRMNTDLRQAMTTPTPVSVGNKKVVHFMNVDWLGKTEHSDRQFNTEENFLETSPHNEFAQDIETANKNQEIQQIPQLFTRLSLTLQKNALRSTSILKKQHSNRPLFKTKHIKISKQVHLKAMKRLFQLMIGGVDGQMLKTMNDKCNIKIMELKQRKVFADKEKKKEQLDKFRKFFKYNYVEKMQAIGEERLSLWLPLSLEEKMMMITAQHIDGEAEIMGMLLLEEIDWFGKGIYKLDELDKIVERGLDNLIYDKYQKLTEKQTLEMVQQNVDRVREEQIEYDTVLLKYMAFLEEKQRTIGVSASVASKRMKRLKDDNKRIQERINWEKQFDLNNVKQVGFKSNMVKYSTQKSSPYKMNKKDRMR